MRGVTTPPPSPLSTPSFSHPRLVVPPLICTPRTPRRTTSRIPKFFFDRVLTPSKSLKILHPAVSAVLPRSSCKYSDWWSALPCPQLYIYFPERFGILVIPLFQHEPRDQSQTLLFRRTHLRVQLVQGREREFGHRSLLVGL